MPAVIDDLSQKELRATIADSGRGVCLFFRWTQGHPLGGRLRGSSDHWKAAKQLCRVSSGDIGRTTRHHIRAHVWAILYPHAITSAGQVRLDGRQTYQSASRTCRTRSAWL